MHHYESVITLQIKKHPEAWHPTTPQEFYALEYQKDKVKEYMDFVKMCKSMHFVILNKTTNQMMGYCNHTKIDNKKYAES